MRTNHLDVDSPLPQLKRYEICYAPHYLPSGVPVAAGLSHQQLLETKEVEVYALDNDAAVQRFERESQRMAINCKRLHEEAVSA